MFNVYVREQNFCSLISLTLRSLALANRTVVREAGRTSRSHLGTDCTLLLKGTIRLLLLVQNATRRVSCEILIMQT